ncbi:hypothetical protein C8E87_0174 [Paractinoplanes brasiliensis]|uniref:Uncharacterized protein n=1 Tax=Paractinoplanes brasiliensis TaxID=52695 RepID=A0A4R6JP94_9ACTN|nr:hypothetical protein C8E87_0174 [Actinoplanes brasiliensis]
MWYINSVIETAASSDMDMYSRIVRLGRRRSENPGGVLHPPRVLLGRAGGAAGRVSFRPP